MELALEYCIDVLQRYAAVEHSERHRMMSTVSAAARTTAAPYIRDNYILYICT